VPNLSGPSAVHSDLRLTEDIGPPPPPPDHSTFNGGGGGGGGVRVGGISLSGPLLTWHILVNSDPPTLYHLLPTPPLRVNRQTTFSYHLCTLTSHSTTSVYTSCSTTLDTSPSTHLSPVTSHPPIIHSLPSTSPPYTCYPLITLHLTPDMPVGQSMQSP
jgi:hypothetical protein